MQSDFQPWVFSRLRAPVSNYIRSIYEGKPTFSLCPATVREHLNS